MSTIRVEIIIPAEPAMVWADVRDLASHVEWMTDAVAIRFTGPTRSGPGTTFDCDTRIGPFRLTDRMTVVEWDEGRTIGITHVGAVTGTGRFVLTPEDGGSRTAFRWEEELRFPWWMGGRMGAVVAGPVLAWVWRRNLRGLAARFDGPIRSG